MTFVLREGTKIYTLVHAMGMQPHRDFTTSELASIIQCKPSDVACHLRKPLACRYVVRTRTELIKSGESKEQGFKVVKQRGNRWPHELAVENGIRKVEPPQPLPVSVLADEFEKIVVLEGGYLFPKVPRSIFELGEAAAA
jgi:hypothetical protein